MSNIINNINIISYFIISIISDAIPNIIKDEHKTYFYNYFKNLYYDHIIILTCLLFNYFIIYSVSGILNYIYLLMASIGFILTIIMILYLFILIYYWNINVRSGLINLRKTSLKLAIKNYRLIQEYNDIYQYHYKSILKEHHDKNILKEHHNKDILREHHKDTLYDQSQSNFDTDSKIKTYANYTIDNDFENRMEKQKWILDAIERITNYIKLSYYLSFISKIDKIDMKSDKLCINIECDATLNKRNRKLELLINSLPHPIRYEIVNIWNKNIYDRNKNNKFLMIIPFKYIVYEYRKIFRYLYSAKYFKDIYTLFDKDYIDIENLTFDIYNCLYKIFMKKIILVPKKFHDYIKLLKWIFLFMVNNLMVITLIMNTISFISFIAQILCCYITHFTITTIINYMEHMMNDLIEPSYNFNNIETIDMDIENIFEEMNMINYQKA